MRRAGIGTKAPRLHRIYSGRWTQTVTTGLRSSIAASVRSGMGLLVPSIRSTPVLFVAAEAPRQKSAHHHVFQHLEALVNSSPTTLWPTVLGVLDAAHADVVELTLYGKHTLRAAKVNPEAIALHLTRLNTPTSTLLHTVWCHEQADQVQDRLICLRTEDQADGTVEVFADAPDIPWDTVSLHTWLVSTATPEATLSPITDAMLLLKLQIIRYQRNTNTARHVPALFSPSRVR